MNSTKVQNPRR